MIARTLVQEQSRNFHTPVCNQDWTCKENLGEGGGEGHGALNRQDPGLCQESRGPLLLGDRCWESAVEPKSVNMVSHLASPL